MIVSAKDFFRCWVNACKQYPNSLAKIYNEDKKKYTKLILGNQNYDCNILPGVVSLLNRDFNSDLMLYSYGPGYYYMDAVLYKKIDLIYPQMEHIWLKKIRIAIEHENNPDYLFCEVAKLLTVMSELKILITYQKYSKEITFENKLKQVHNIISETENASEISKNREFIVIYGYLNSGKNDFEWKGLVFSIGKWICI